MIPNVVKGSDMGGLLRYLVDTRENRTENAHVDPHVVGGDAFLVSWHGNEILDFDAAKEITDYLEEPRRTYGTEIRTKVWDSDPDTGERKVRTEVDPISGKAIPVYRDQHTWHCSLSLRADEGSLGDENWQQVSQDFMDRMGFTEASEKAPCRWVAIHHGTSADGNDHIHIAASMVREDGTRWEGRYRDFQAAQSACRELEVKYGLVRVEGREHGTAVPGVQRAELEQMKRAGAATPPSVDLAHRVRAAAVASTSEAEWIRRVRDEGVVIKPYFARGTTDVVSGYRVALRGAPGERLVFRGGGRLGKDLSLPRLRERWGPATLDQASELAAEWQAAFKGRPPTTTSGRERSPLAPTASDVATQRLGGMHEQLRGLSLEDRAGWASGAHDVAGALAAWSAFDKENAAELRAAAHAVARSAQQRRMPRPPKAPRASTGMATAFLFAAASPKDKGAIKAAALTAQLVSAVSALRDYHRAVGHTRQAELLEREAISRLERLPVNGYRPVHMSAEEERAWDAHRLVRGGTSSPTAGGDPLPRPLAPRARSHATNGKGERDEFTR